ncbi:9464_t:CDS:2 [Gigaspora margarita]|uniref:9464_t:CDS:1 n=1 Tax=Gigaspora margarita TaxID=4874 RepID=A0ABN7W600_GIGMA|nr:9464_t:CDS:2 [Gigaspora margarita]
MNFIPNNPFPFTPGLVHHTYPCYSPLSKDFQVQKYKLMLDGRHWSLHCGDKEKNISQQIFAHYGYADDISKAQILRSQDEKQVVVSFLKNLRRLSNYDYNKDQIAFSTIFEGELFDQAPSSDDALTSNNDSFDVAISPDSSTPFTYIPPIISESSDKEVTQDEWSKSFWRRLIKRSIVNGQPSLNKLTVNIDAFGISKGSELVIEGINNEGKHITKEFGETIYEFLISLM